MPPPLPQVGGLQCDVWRGPSANLTSAPASKLRLPDCPGPTHEASDRCQVQANFQLEQLLPGLALAYPAAAGGPSSGTFSVRCWGYSMLPLEQLSAGPEGANVRVWLAGSEVGGGPGTWGKQAGLLGVGWIG
jgi:hypothetical protein